MTLDLEARILDRLDTLSANLADLRGEVRAFRESQAQICKASQVQRDEHHRVIFGNGTPGLKSCVQDLHGKVQDLTAKIGGITCPGPCGESGLLSGHKKTLAVGAGASGLTFGAIEIVRAVIDHFRT